MLDHFGFIVSDLVAARRFYEAALTPLGLAVTEEQPQAFIMTKQGQHRPFVFIGTGRPTYWGETSSAGGAPVHFGFTADTREQVDAFYKAGIEAGGRDNGAPGPRGKGYYAAYLLDADNNNIEAGVREA